MSGYELVWKVPLCAAAVPVTWRLMGSVLEGGFPWLVGEDVGRPRPNDGLGLPIVALAASGVSAAVGFGLGLSVVWIAASVAAGLAACVGWLGRGKGDPLFRGSRAMYAAAFGCDASVRGREIAALIAWGLLGLASARGVFTLLPPSVLSAVLAGAAVLTLSALVLALTILPARRAETEVYGKLSRLLYDTSRSINRLRGRLRRLAPGTVEDEDGSGVSD